MSDFLLIKFLHVIGLAYWLGGDLGVFYSSFIVSNESAPTKVRCAAAKMLFALDQAPRICMTLMLPLGLHLAWRLGALPFSVLTMSIIWIVALSWTATVIFLHFGANARAKSFMTPLDYWFRVAVSLGLIGVGALSLLSGSPALPYWISLKLGIFGVLIGLGLVVRIVLKEFGPAYVSLLNGAPTPEDNAAIRRSLGRTRPIVMCIWLGLLASTALGIHLV